MAGPRTTLAWPTTVLMRPMPAQGACVDRAAAIGNPAAIDFGVFSLPKSQAHVITKLRAASESRPAMTARLAVGPGAVARAIAFARRFTAAAALPAAAADRLVLIVEEWVANVVEHGCPAPGSLIVLRLETADGRVRLRFSDAGIAFDPRTAEDVGPNLDRGGGAGIALIRAWSDVEVYQRRAGRNRLVLRSRS